MDVPASPKSNRAPPVIGWLVVFDVFMAALFLGLAGWIFLLPVPADIHADYSWVVTALILPAILLLVIAGLLCTKTLWSYYLALAVHGLGFVLVLLNGLSNWNKSESPIPSPWSLGLALLLWGLATRQAWRLVSAEEDRREASKASTTE